MMSLVQSTAHSRHSANASLFPSFFQTLRAPCFPQALPNKMGREPYCPWHLLEVVWDRERTRDQESGSPSSATC